MPNDDTKETSQQIVPRHAPVANHLVPGCLIHDAVEFGHHFGRRSAHLQPLTDVAAFSAAATAPGPTPRLCVRKKQE